MTTLTLTGFAVSRDTTIADNVVDVRPMEFEVVYPDGETGFTYIIENAPPYGPDNLPIADEDLDTLNLRLGGLEVGLNESSFDVDSFFFDVSWVQGGAQSTTAFLYEIQNVAPSDFGFSVPGFSTIDLDFIYVLGGAPLPPINTIADWEAFESLITGLSIASPPFAPGVEIPLASLGGTFTENDLILGSPTGDNIATGAGRDTLNGEDGDDILNGGAQRDRLFGDAGDDTLNGGLGNDTVNGGTGADQIAGRNGSDILRGEGGGDRINGGNGEDTLFGGGGGDVLNGGADNDRITGGDGQDTMNGGAGDDEIFGGASADTANGGSGNDTILGENGADVLSGGSGNDSVEGGNQSDVLNGGTGNDTLKGGNGNDTLNGDGARDRIFGGKGADTIDGGAGNDVITGGAGDDTFLFSAGNDRITDFTAGSAVDQIDMTGPDGWASFTAIQNGGALTTDTAGNAVVTDQAGHAFTLVGVAVGDLTQNDFIF